MLQFALVRVALGSVLFFIWLFTSTEPLALVVIFMYTLLWILTPLAHLGKNAFPGTTT